MVGRIEARLKDLGITLPGPMAPIVNYVPYIVAGNLVSIAGKAQPRVADIPFLGE